MQGIRKAVCALQGGGIEGTVGIQKEGGVGNNEVRRRERVKELHVSVEVTVGKVSFTGRDFTCEDDFILIDSGACSGGVLKERGPWSVGAVGTDDTKTLKQL